MDIDSRLPATPESLSPAPPSCVRDVLGQDPPTASFERWRPSFHLQPLSGWMNDPCGPGFDPTTGLYHVSFQWNPRDNDWGDISWGHATSPDFVSWDLDPSPSLSPDKPYDHLGVFTGCFHASDASPLTYVYTSVNSLPIHHTLPYKRGCESLSIAISTDNGQTWTKHPSNPIIPSAPPDVEVTGWRDPFVSNNTLYGIISGGIVNKTATTFLYTIDRSDFTKWEYLGPLVDVGLNMRPSRWSGDLGRNWEVTNFVTLHDSLDWHLTRDFIIMGTEGCIDAGGADPSEYAGALKRPPRSKEADQAGERKPVMDYSFGGYLDHGCYYAANSFFDPVTQSHIVWGWITEDDLSDTLRHQQNWSGMLSLPRRLQLTSIRRVSRAWKSDITSITSVEAMPDGLGTYTVRTLTSIPDSRVVNRSRTRPGVRLLYLPPRPLEPSGTEVLAQEISSKTWELFCRIKVSRKCKKTGFRVGHRKDFSKETAIYFEPNTETFTIERPAFDTPDSALHINSAPETAAHTLFTTVDHASGETETESLEIRVWRDNSVFEVFVNERTAITTRIYAGDETVGLRFFADEEHEGDQSLEAPTRLDHAVIWG
ncbi:putative beta-Fructufuranosidase [Thozetella sp. PMI_491]|nr:putative beta-Fructufuranosidase [Thozetella sp. PMI_491]